MEFALSLPPTLVEIYGEMKTAESGLLAALVERSPDPGRTHRVSKK